VTGSNRDKTEQAVTKTRQNLMSAYTLGECHWSIVIGTIWGWPQAAL
jgi:hypothetical protein